MPDQERDLRDPEVIDAAIAAGKADGGLAADLSLIANEALHDVHLRDQEIEQLKAELARTQARALTAELALQNQTDRAARYVNTHRHVAAEVDDADFFDRTSGPDQQIGAMS